MAQLVFVHGVANRTTPSYKQNIEHRNELFRNLMFADTKVEIHSPMWGDGIPEIPPGVFETDSGVATFSLNLGAPAAISSGLTATDLRGTVTPSISDIGKQDAIAALDIICSQIFDRAASENRPLTAQEMQAFRKAVNVIATDSADSMFAGDPDNATLAEKFTADIPGSFGIGSSIRDAITAATDQIRHTVSKLGFGVVRDSLHPAVGLFIGDVFVYLKQGNHRKEIQKTVGDALTSAHALAKKEGGPLIVVGHSMGGVILADMLANPTVCGLQSDIKVDALLTVGSQPGLFAALQVLARDPSTTTYRKPECVGLWLNVFDPIDPLAFRTEMIFGDSNDLAFNSVAGIVDTHSKYFQRPQFYARCRVRLQENGIL